MDSDLKKVVHMIGENTGIRLSVYGEDGRPLYGEGRAVSPDFKGIAQDDAADTTRFRARYRDVQYIFSLAGSGPVQKNYAFLLADMIENSASRAVNLPKGEFIRRILLGECAAGDIQKYRL